MPSKIVQQPKEPYVSSYINQLSGKDLTLSFYIIFLLYFSIFICRKDRELHFHKNGIRERSFYLRFRAACVAEVGPDPGYRSPLRQDSAFFFRIRTRSQKFVKNRIRSHYSISAVAGVCAVISKVKTWVNQGWINDCSWSLNRSRILKFEEEPSQI